MVPSSLPLATHLMNPSPVTSYVTQTMNRTTAQHMMCRRNIFGAPYTYDETTLEETCLEETTMEENTFEKPKKRQIPKKPKKEKKIRRKKCKTILSVPSLLPIPEIQDLPSHLGISPIPECQESQDLPESPLPLPIECPMSPSPVSPLPLPLPIECPMCPMKFMGKPYLRTHIISHVMTEGRTGIIKHREFGDFLKPIRYGYKVIIINCLFVCL